MPPSRSTIVSWPDGYNTNFFSGRVYDPQAIYTDEQTVTIVFAGYNTPQPSNKLGDYRSIGRFQVQFPSATSRRSKPMLRAGRARPLFGLRDALIRLA